jgi:hypothetical protein
MRFSKDSLETSPSSCSETGAYCEVLVFALEEDMLKRGFKRRAE